MTHHRRKARSPIALALAALVVVALVAGVVGYLRRDGARRFYVELPQAPGVKEGVPVWYRGVAVGTVDSLGFTAERVRLRLAITRRDLALRRDDRAHLAPMGVAGTNAVDILPGPSTSPLLDDGSQLSFAWPDTVRVATPQQTDSMIRAIIQRSERAKDSARGRVADSTPRRRAGPTPRR